MSIGIDRWKAQQDEALRARLKELAARHNALRLSPVDGDAGAGRNSGRNRQSVSTRLYCAAGLAMRIRQRRRIRWSGTGAKPAAKRRNERWSMDFVSDCISSGRVVRMLTLVDDYTREVSGHRGRYLAGWLTGVPGGWIE